MTILGSPNLDIVFYESYTRFIGGSGIWPHFVSPVLGDLFEEVLNDTI